MRRQIVGPEGQVAGLPQDHGRFRHAGQIVALPCRVLRFELRGKRTLIYAHVVEPAESRRAIRGCSAHIMRHQDGMEASFIGFGSVFAEIPSPFAGAVHLEGGAYSALAFVGTQAQPSGGARKSFGFTPPGHHVLCAGFDGNVGAVTDHESEGIFAQPHAVRPRMGGLVVKGNLRVRLAELAHHAPGLRELLGRNVLKAGIHDQVRRVASQRRPAHRPGRQRPQPSRLVMNRSSSYLRSPHLGLIRLRQKSREPHPHHCY